MGIIMMRLTLETDYYKKSEKTEKSKDNKYIHPKINSKSIVGKGAL